MSQSDKLESAFQNIRDTFFPRWDPKRQWCIKLDPNIECWSIEGWSISDRKSKTIYLRYLVEDPNKLDRRLIHSICDALYSNHGKKWQKRLLKAANLAERKEKAALARLLRKEVEFYQKALEYDVWELCWCIQNLIWDAVYEGGIYVEIPSFKNVIRALPSKTWVPDLYPHEITKHYKECRKVYEYTVKRVKYKRKIRDFINCGYRGKELMDRVGKYNRSLSI